MTVKMFQILFIIILLKTIPNETKVYSSLDNMYKKGVEAYSGERWSECITQFEEAIQIFRLYKSVISNCLQKCNSLEPNKIVLENIDDLQIYEKYFKRRVCYNVCKAENLHELSLSTASDSVLIKLQTRKPYDYLHICYYQMNDLPKSASSSSTYLVANPDDENMKKNLEYYIEQPEVAATEVIDFESNNFDLLYRQALKAYHEGNSAESVAAMEEALTEYIMSENQCRTNCEELQTEEGGPDLVNNIANLFLSDLHCKNSCQNLAKVLFYESGINLLADFLNYLQISYYRLNKLKDAAKAVESYLLLLPDDEDMLENKKIYSSLIDEEAFKHRPEIAYYYKRNLYENKLLTYNRNTTEKLRF